MALTTCSSSSSSGGSGGSGSSSMIDNQNAHATYAILPALPRQAQDHPAWLPRQAQDKDIKRIWPTKEGVSRVAS
jgi:hypothetical protein